MALTEVGEYSAGAFTYTLFYDGNKTFTLPLKFEVLNHFHRKGINKPDLTKFHFPSDVTVRFFSNSEDILDWFNGSGDKTFMIKITENSTLIFQGFYVPVPQFSSYNLRDNAYDLKFHDGIELLKKTTNAISGFTTIDTFLRGALDSIGFELPINILINITGANILTNDYSPSSMRTSFQTILDRSPNASYYDLLSAFLTVFKAFIYQENGKWYIREYAFRDETLTFEIALNGTITSSSSARPLSTPTVLEDSKRSTLNGIYEFNRTVKNNNDNFQILNSDFSKWNEDYTVLEDWELESGSIDPPFQFEDFNGVIFKESTTKLHQIRTRVASGYGLPTFNFEGNVYLNGSVGTYDIAIAELIVYVRDADDRESGFTKYWAHEPTVSTVLSTTQEYIYTEVEITSGHSVNVPVDFSKMIDVSLTLYRDFYFEIRLLDLDEAVLTTSNGRRREYNLAELDQPKSLNEVSDSELIKVYSTNLEGDTFNDEVFFSDKLISIRDFDFQILDENLDWKDAVDWKDRFESDVYASKLNQKVIENFFDKYASARLFIKIKVLKSDKPSLETKLSFEYKGITKSFDVLYVQDQASSKIVDVYAIEAT
ncbi:MAG TPA: hypothetical protein DEO59_03040 [Balneola sp.]|nr:hypothetical protein [Balneola sp.]MAO78938.1 hypothetical protein [Balneola sp.]MBF63597.1 hypothetical protein [Balneola sp.]HAW80323.1 hypothetical protein [Balneola sp.]HBZ37481.1 hypothetical protein [Balneola sp.]|tara:strand:- start:2137 stop:3930 length:1794 start_codon:yes stop_codon:yes gene_type:complete